MRPVLLDIAELPEICTTKQLAAWLHKSEAALAQDRYLHQGIPFVKYGRLIRYLKSDVIAYLTANRDSAGISA